MTTVLDTTITAPEPPSVRDVLVAAREVLQERGWARGIYTDRKGCVCALGALRIATLGSESLDDPSFVSESAFHKGERALYQAAAPRTVIYLNDDPRTTEADIYALFDRAIAAAEAAGR